MMLISATGGAVAAAGPLFVCLVVALVGWFSVDAGAHGTPTDAMGVGAAGWLLAHGSGVTIEGARIGLVPLGLTMICAWVSWRSARRVGEAVSGHGPDADMLADGARDWTVPGAAGMFAAGYFAVAAAAALLVADAAPSLPRVAVWCLLLGAAVVAPAIAIGSGRAAVWTANLPRSATAAGAIAFGIVRTILLAALATLVVTIALHIGATANVLNQLHTDIGDAAMLIGLTVLVLPNATVWTGTFLLGPGFAIGTGTVVSPAVVSLGPLPMFPLFAALPADGPGPGWAAGLVVVPTLLAAVAAARVARRYPTTRWDEGALRACAGGVLAGIGYAVFALLSSGAIGPGRMADVGPNVLDTLVAGITWFGLGALIGGVAMTWWHRRQAPAAA
jgi:Family of unknown function (DUF6350)